MSSFWALMGIDPGVSGGIAVLRNDGAILYVRGFNTVETERELSLILRDATAILKSYPNSQRCYMEKVQYIGKRPGKGKGDGGKGAFTFGKIYGFLKGNLSARDVSILDVYPAMWQAKLECLTRGNKNISKRKAREIFGFAVDLKITHAIADALLIAEYGRRIPSGV